MNSIAPSTIKGFLPAPPSKSMTLRALAAGLLAPGVSRIRNVSLCDDGHAALKIVEALGAEISRDGEDTLVRSPGIRNLKVGSTIVDCRESGLSMRMFSSIAALLPVDVTLTASGSLSKRPMEMVTALDQVGASCRTDHGYAPLSVKGPLEGGRMSIDANISSQFLTGLLMALPVCPKASLVSVSGLKSSPYVRMTVELIRRFGIRLSHDEGLKEFTIEGGQTYLPSTYAIEGDWSGAAFLLVAGAIAGKVTMTGLDLNSLQADRAVIEALDASGAGLLFGKDELSVEKRKLNAFVFDATDCPDLFPPLAALAALCEGTSVIYGAQRLAHKESDRAQALREEFGKLDILIEMCGNRMEVQGGRVRGGEVNSHNDHRIAMACAVAALQAQGKVLIQDSECVAKSYPAFFSDLERLRGTT